MSKAAAMRFFVVLLTLFLFVVSIFSAYAEQFDNPEASQNALYSETSSTEPTETGAFAEPAVPTTEPIIPAEFPALTVNAISNVFPKSSAEYNVNTKEVTVTYWLHSTKDLLSVQWNLIYDPEVLSFSLEKNPSRNICPSISENSVLSFPDKNILRYCATSMSLFDFSSQDMPFVQLVFDVNKLNPEEPVSTKIDLTVENMIVSDIDRATGYSKSSSELTVVDDSIEFTDIDPLFERITKMTTLTASNFVQATSAPPQPQTVLVTDQSGSVVAVETVEQQTTELLTAASTAANPTEPTEAEPTTEQQETTPRETGSVDTGGQVFAWICLGIIFVSTLILFIMRKKEIMF